MKVYLYPPNPTNEDPGDGGVRRVIEGMYKHLPDHGVELISDPAQADLIACHIEIPEEWPRNFPEKPFVVHNHGLYWAEYSWGDWAIDLNRRCMEAVRLADAVTVPSWWCAEPIARAVNRRPYVIPHGVDLDEWLPVEQPGTYVWWDKTRSDPVCDPKPVNECAIRLPNVRFKTTLGEARNNVEVVGRRPFAEAREITRNAGVYLATSRETFGLGTLQALAAGVPVVAFDWGAHREWITHKVDGWLAKPGNFDDLATGILWALDNREDLSRRSRELAQRFTWDGAAQQYAEVYRRTIAEHRAKRPTVSFIVRAYNAERYIAATLDSIRDQALDDWECIIVDDASTDDTHRIARVYELADDRFHIIPLAENHGISGAMNVGVDASRGRYIMAVDSDDMLRPQAAAQLARSLDHDRTIDIAYGGVHFVQVDGETPADFGTGKPGDSGWPMPYDFTQQMRNYNFVPYCAMYRRRVWQAVGGHRTRLATGEDADFWTRATSYGYRAKMVTKDPSITYRIREDSVSRGKPKPRWVDWLGWSVNRDYPPAGAQTPAQVGIPSHTYPLVSVVIPVGPGHEVLVRDAIDSVEAQTFVWWECIVVNDSGNPLPLLPAWVKVIDTPKAGSGPAAARNLGISAARAECFVPLDADDILMPAALERMHEVWRQRGVIVYSDCWLEHADRMEYYRTKDWSCEGVLKKGVHGVTALTPVAVWRKAGGYDETVEAWEDWDFQIRSVEKGYCSARIAEPLFLYRMTAGSRREEHFASQEAHLAAVESRYGDYIHGRKRLMGCGCGGNKTATIQAPQAGQGNELSVSGDTVRMRLEGDGPVMRRFKGPSGQTYHMQAGQERYVYRRDWEEYFSPKEGFVLVSDAPMADPSEGPALVAAPPAISPSRQPDARAAEPSPEERLTAIVGKPAASALVKAGFVTAEQMRHVSDEELAAVQGVGKRTVEKLREAYR